MSTRIIKTPSRGAFAIWCPACKEEHPFDKKRWEFNGDFDKPTFSPSMLIRIGPMPEDHPDAGKIHVCHSFVKEGNIQYLGDCTHAMAGQTIELPVFPNVKYKQAAEDIDNSREDSYY